jgi:hypothetical protein
LLICALAASGAAWARDTGARNDTSSGMRNADGVLLEHRDIYVPVDKDGHVTGNEMFVVQKETFVPARELPPSASGRVPGGDATYVLLPDPGDSAGAPSPRYHLERLQR